MTLTSVALAGITRALSFMGAVSINTRLRAQEVAVAAAERASFVIAYIWGYDQNAGNTEHHSGLAADFMVFGNKAAGDWIYNYLWNNRARLHVRHIIWQQSITSTVVSPGVRRAMADRGNGTANHRDHVHVLFLDNTTYAPPGKPVVKAKPAAKPAPKTLAPLHVGSTGPSVAALQRGLNSHFPAYSHLAVDGGYGTKTAAVVSEFQKRVGFTGKNIDGVVGPMTRAKLRTFGINC